MNEPDLEVVASGALATLQDAGRFGYRHVGIPWAGTLAEPWRRLAVALLDEADDAAVIEAFEAGLTLRAGARPVRLATAGDLSLERVGAAGERTPVPAWQSLTLEPGDSLRVLSSGRARLGLIAVQGLSIDPVLGSVSTYTRAGIGGLHGGPLRPGDRLPVAGHAGGAERRLDPDDVRDALALAGLTSPAAKRNESGRTASSTSPDRTTSQRSNAAPLRLRAMPGPQDDHFAPDALEAFFSTERWRVADGTDRMGCRLDGAPLRHLRPSLADIVSDAILPGSVQVPANGEPIVMFSDAHTLGGYPKIATVIGADLVALALARPGTALRFERVDESAAIGAARDRAELLDAMRARIGIATRRPDSASLLERNLIDGVVDAKAPIDANAALPDHQP